MDDLERAFLQGAARALRTRARRQAEIAQAGTIIGERQAVIRSGEAAIAALLADAFSAVAADLEKGAQQ